MKNAKLQEIEPEHKFFTLEALPQETRKKLLFLNNYQLKMLNLTPRKELTLRIGVTELPVKTALQNIYASPTAMYLSKAALNDLPFYQGEPLRLILRLDQKLILGPALGLTVSQNTWENITKSDSLKKRALLALEKGILFYCFRLKKVDWENNSVEAYCLNPSDYNWVKKIVPVPRIIHDRGSYPGLKTIASFPNKGNVQNIQWINTTRTFGKWETYQALKSLPKTLNYLPETTLFAAPKLAEFLEKYKYVFIKGNYGRSGRQVYRVEKEDNAYLCKTGGSVIKSRKFNDLEKLGSFLHKTLGEYLILQQGILLAHIDDSPFDMRILVQKNINNNWIISALNFRIAKPGAIVTNFAAGARDVFTVPGERLLHPKLSWEIITTFTLQTVQALENFFGNLGEIGLDVALDREGKLWLFEANSRPSSMAYRDAQPEACRQIFGLPLDYACYLARQSSPN
ncbi:MAG: YheC/YheD family protein [Peptococcaceae bacterium]